MAEGKGRVTNFPSGKSKETNTTAGPQEKVKEAGGGTTGAYSRAGNGGRSGWTQGKGR